MSKLEYLDQIETYNGSLKTIEYINFSKVHATCVPKQKCIKITAANKSVRHKQRTCNKNGQNITPEKKQKLHHNSRTIEIHLY
jgi:hypothetical protein